MYGRLDIKLRALRKRRDHMGNSEAHVWIRTRGRWGCQECEVDQLVQHFVVCTVCLCVCVLLCVLRTFTSPSFDSRRRSLLQVARMSPASAWICTPLGASMYRERVGDSKLWSRRSWEHTHQITHEENLPPVQSSIKVTVTHLLRFQSGARNRAEY